MRRRWTSCALLGALFGVMLAGGSIASPLTVGRFPPAQGAILRLRGGQDHGDGGVSQEDDSDMICGGHGIGPPPGDALVLWVEGVGGWDLTQRQASPFMPDVGARQERNPRRQRLARSLERLGDEGFDLDGGAHAGLLVLNKQLEG